VPGGAGGTEPPAVGATDSARVAQLLEQGILERYPRCPVCGSERRIPVAASGSDNRYLRAIPLVAPISLPEVLALLTAHRCEDCTAAWCDPWLSRRSAARLYTSGFGQHNGGWQIFHASRTGSEVETHAWWQRHVWERIRAVAGSVDRLVELNCPFGGLLTYFRRREAGLAEYRRLARVAARELRSRRRHPRGVASALRGAFDQRRPVDRQAPLAEAASGFPGERVLAVEPSSACWGGNCISRGLACQSLAPSLLAADGLPLGEIEKAGVRFDVAVLTQLDHFFEPMSLLDRFLDLAELVVVLCHHSNHFTRQHPFAFGPRTAAFFEERGCTAFDATPETVHPAKREVNQCVFVSRRLNLRQRTANGSA
jgi:hypothetical protein